MPVVYTHPLLRRYHAPFGSGAYIFMVLGWISMIIFAFLISFFTGQMWVKESSYREQPGVTFRKSFAVKLQGVKGENLEPFEAMYSTVPSMNSLAGENVRVPIVTSSTVDSNLDLVADMIRINVTFPLMEDEKIMGVQGVFVFNYALSVLVRLDMEAPITIGYSGGVPGRALFVDGRMALKLANPLPIMPQVRGSQVDPLLPSSKVFTAPEATFPAVMERVSNRNDSTVLDPATSAWEAKYASCGKSCDFTVALTVRIPPEKVLYIPPFIEVAKFSWIQFLCTFIFIWLILRLLPRFVMENQIIQTVVRDDMPKSKVY